ncbi:MAG TPA: farnesyl diphosphate synthase [Candidatus Eisenbacteria bacterium]|nr:farnesyl diphosphate synthase [Candidatus Eisenbacteria bacterium]
MAAATRRVDTALDRLLPREKKRPPIIHRAMRYTALAEGKRLRPALVLLAHEASGGKSAAAVDVAAAVEMVHAFSLIHDDLPAMDDDTMRRGKPSNHVVFGEGVAILAGDGLLTQSFQTLAGTRRSLGAATVARLVEELSLATGPEGVIGGQVLDLLCEGKHVPLSVVAYIHRHKTAKLFMASLRLGGIVAGATPAKLTRLERYGQDLGTAFQIVDDILGAAGSFRELGRDPGRDVERGKVTYPSVMGLPAAHRAVDRLIARAGKETRAFGSHAVLFEGALALVDRRRRDANGQPIGAVPASS